MDENMMTQQELAEKYGADDGTVSQALSLAGLFRKYKKKVYPESEAVAALIRLYRNREERFREMAETWRVRADKAAILYEYGDEENETTGAEH